LDEGEKKRRQKRRVVSKLEDVAMQSKRPEYRRVKTLIKVKGKNPT